MSKDTFGRLKFLKRGGSTARVIDLVSIAHRYQDEPAYHDAPMFQNRRLNVSFIVKHTLRAWEREQLGGKRISATKVIIPISDDDLDMGGHSIFVEDPSMSERLAAHLGVNTHAKAFNADIQRLRELATLPSFDPYLLHEYFRRQGAPVAPLYFTISAEEVQHISEFVAGQINLLVRRAMDEGAVGDLKKSKRLASVLFEDQDSPQLEVLRQALRMTAEEYKEGVFGWKGTLYYSWRAGQCYDDLLAFIQALKMLDLSAMSVSDRQDIQKIIRSIGLQAIQRWNRLQAKLDLYHQEFTRFVERGDPAALTAFLRRAPDLFVEMGEDISRLQHVAAYWDFWTQGRKMISLTGAEAFELLPDFEAALTMTASQDGA